MALVALTASSVIMLQWQSTHRLTQVVEDSQALGLAHEALAIQWVGASPDQTPLNQRLARINPNLRGAWDGPGGGARIWAAGPDQPQTVRYHRIRVPTPR